MVVNRMLQCDEQIELGGVWHPPRMIMQVRRNMPGQTVRSPAILNERGSRRGGGGLAVKKVMFMGLFLG
jgi:hypothetical protein